MIPGIVGAHLRNEASLKPPDTALYATARFNGALCFWYQNPADIVGLVGKTDAIVVRLHDTYSDNRVWGEEELRASWQSTITTFVQHGITRFIIDNEPNESWASVQPPVGQTRPQMWAWLVRRVLKALIVPQGVTLILTPLMLPSLNGAWHDEMAVSEPGFPSILSYCRAAAAHCYWQAEADMDADWAGRSYGFVHQHSGGLPVYITEAGCSSNADTLNKQIRDYPVYIDKVGEDAYVERLLFFILGQNGNWPLFDIVQPVAEAIGNHIGGLVNNSPDGGGGSGSHSVPF